MIRNRRTAVLLRNKKDKNIIQKALCFGPQSHRYNSYNKQQNLSRSNIS